MSYDDELERSRARRSRRRGAGSQLALKAEGASGTADAAWASLAEPGSRSDRLNGGAGRSSRGGRNGGGKWKKIVLGIVLGIVVLAIVAAGAVYLYFQKQFEKANPDNFNAKEVENIELSQEKREKMEEGYWTIAVFGLDSRDSSMTGQSDVIMIVNIDRKTGEIKLASVFRDTYLNISDRNAYNKINAAYAQGGATQALKALNKNLDLNITDYATFNWKAVAWAISILGGIDVDISRSEFYYINAFITETVKGTGIGSTHLKKAGLNHLDGVQAVAYGRLRLMDSDYARTERQRLVIQKAFEKAKQADLNTLNVLVGTMFDLCETNIKLNDVIALVPSVTKYHLGESVGFPMARGEQRIRLGSSRQDCVIPQTLVSNVSSLHAFLFGEENYMPTSQVQTISNKIAEVSGLSKAGEEIGHVRTDQGYIPKATKAAAAETTKAKEKDESESEEKDESESSTSESGESESSSLGESESSEGMGAGNWESSAPGESESPTMPTAPTAPTMPRETNEEGGPRSPADVIGETGESYGPGFEEVPTEAPMYPGQTPNANPNSQGGPSSVVVEPTASSGNTVPGGNTAPTAPASNTAPTMQTAPTANTAPTAPAANTVPTAPAANTAPTAPAANTAPTAPAANTAPSSPADLTVQPGNTAGPGAALQGPESAAPGM